MKLHQLITTLFILFYSASFSQPQKLKGDSLRVDELNRLGYAIRLTDPEQTISYAEKAEALATRQNYKDGIAEANRIKGIGYYYLNKSEIAISFYLKSLSIFTEINNEPGRAKVYNNIGNLYRDIDFDKGLYYYDQSLKLAKKLNLKELTAGSYLNIGSIFSRKKNFYLALKNSEEAYKIFVNLNNAIGTTQSLHNRGVIYFKLKQIKKAEELLLEANQKAKENELNNTIASIDLTLTSIYIAKKQFQKAEEILNEGKAYAEIVKDNKLELDYLYTSYELENNRKNYQQALYYLREVYKQDSITFKNLESQKIGLFQEQAKQREQLARNQIRLEQEKRKSILFWASLTVLTLSVVVIILLVMNVKKKAKTNKQLKALNNEISLQKENLDRINHNLEGIIAERTKDLQIKNKKLSAYSSHLSHQIRSPIATMKGLMLLEQEHLIEEEEFIKEIGKCVNEIDDKILNINKTLHDPEDQSF